MSKRAGTRTSKQARQAQPQANGRTNGTTAAPSKPAGRTAAPSKPAGRTAAPPRPPRRSQSGRTARTARPRARSAGVSTRAAGALRRVPTTAWVCALIATLNAVCWSILVPPLQGPDEQAHFAYTQYIAEAGKLPSSAEENYSSEEVAAMNDLGFGETILNPGTVPVPTRASRRHLVNDLAQSPSRKGRDGSAGVADSEPPLYYVLQLVPYELGSGSSLLTRLELMRLLSTLLMGLTVLFVFLFLREALPAAPWAWTVGALCAALSPLVGFVGSSIDPDALELLVCAALFYSLARSFRRGFTPRMAAALGALVLLGLVSKLTFVGVVPGALLGILLLSLRELRSHGRAALRPMAIAYGVLGLPVALWAAHNLLTHQSILGIISGTISTFSGHPLSFELGYTWQFYLPRLPGMTDYFPGMITLWDIWFKGIVARYNWLETVFPEWVYEAALIPAAVVGGLCLRELYVMRRALRSRLPEFVAYLAIGLGVMLMLASASFGGFPTLAAGVSEPRYFLPLLALGSTLLALAARGAGKRWGPVAGVAIVMLFLTHDILSQLLEVSRYYHPLHY